MTMTRVALGRWGEQRALVHLQRLGWKVVAQNWRNRHGEVDLIAFDGTTLVFVEVKTRRGRHAGSPLEAITQIKIATLRRMAAAWLAAQDEHVEQVRLDAVGLLRTGGAWELEHVRGVG